MMAMGYRANIPHGVMFHYFHGGNHPSGQGALSQQCFEAIIQLIGVRRILSPAEWLEKLDEDVLENRDICLTFDDGLLSQFDLALPILEKYRLKAFWFIYSCVFEGGLGKLEIYRTFRLKCFSHVDDFYQTFFRKICDLGYAERASGSLDHGEIQRRLRIFPFYSFNDVKFRLIRDNALTRTEYEQLMDALIIEHGVSLEELSKELWMSNDHLKYLCDTGHVIGLHSYSHPTVLAALPGEAQQVEYEKNRRHILSVCGKAPVAVAHPCGSYNRDTLAILRLLGVRCGFRSNLNSGMYKYNYEHQTCLEIGREDSANVAALLRRQGTSASTTSQRLQTFL